MHKKSIRLKSDTKSRVNRPNSFCPTLEGMYKPVCIITRIITKELMCFYIKTHLNNVCLWKKTVND